MVPAAIVIVRLVVFAAAAPVQATGHLDNYAEPVDVENDESCYCCFRCCC